MYKIEFYENQHGESEVWDFLEALRVKSKSSKDARIQYNQIIFYIDLLAKNGTNLPINITKHLEEDIWELRPGNNRIFYFYYDESQYVLLHHFRKKHRKHRNGKSPVPKQNATITSVRRRQSNENLGRL